MWLVRLLTQRVEPSICSKHSLRGSVGPVGGRIRVVKAADGSSQASELGRIRSRHTTTSPLRSCDILSTTVPGSRGKTKGVRTGGSRPECLLRALRRTCHSLRPTIVRAARRAAASDM